MSSFADSALMAANPEFGVPMEIGKQLAPHAPTILMIPLVVFAIVLIIIGVIIIAAAKTKTAGIILTVLGFMLGGGAFFIMYRTERKNASGKTQ